MSNLLKSKLLVGVLVVAVFAFVGVAFATTASADCTITTTLRVGSHGVEVQCLQSSLGITADGSFGPMTKAAVMAWQASKGLSADGVFGPISRSAWVAQGSVSGNFPAGCSSAAGYSSTTGVKCDSAPSSGLPAGCSSTSGYSTTTGKKCDGSTTGGGSTSGGLEGGAGSITLTAKSTYSNEEVVAGDEEVPVLAFQVEADDNSDVEVTSVKVEFYNSDTSSSRRLSDYADKVSILMNGDKVGEADASDFSESSKYYSKTISLNDAIVRAGDKEQFAVAVTALNNLDSGDINSDSWNVDLINVRFEDADGVTTTESADAAGDNAAGSFDRDIDFNDLATSGDLEVKLSTASASPKASNVEVDTSSTTDVTMLQFTLKATGSDVTVDSMEMTGTATGVDATWADIVSSLSLEADGDELDSVSAYADAVDDTTGDIHFSNLDFTISEGDTVTFKVVAKVRAMATPDGASGTAFDRGDSFLVSFTTADLEDADTDITDSNGDSVGAADLTGSAIGEAQSFYDIGVAVDMGTVTYEAVSDGANTEQVTYNIPLTVTAFGANRYLGLSADLETDYTTISDAQAFSYAFQNSSASSTDIEAGGTLASTSTFNCDADIESSTAYRLDEGEAVHCTLQVIMTAPPTNSNSYRVHVEGVQTNDVAALTDGATHEIIQLLSPEQDFQTAYKFITS